jgi:glutamate---cysteine ligase / carboxylate-amine ligase
MRLRGSSRKVGIEEELLLVDGQSLRPVPVSAMVVGGHVDDDVLLRGAVLESEVKREQIEVVSPPLSTYDELFEAVITGRRAADDGARIFGARAVALATSPVRCDSHTVPSRRYDLMRERFGLTMVEQLTCGFHVHVTIASPEEGVAVLDRIRPWLPVILALSANSPFWWGGDSEYASYRYQAWLRWPTAGAYDRYGSASAYEATVDRLLQSGVCLDAGMMYFDARLSSHAPTVEVRIADVCLHPEDAACLAVLIRALAEAAAAEWRNGMAADDVPTDLLRLASWRASRFGVTAELLHPIRRRPAPAATCVRSLLDHVSGHFPTHEEEARVRRGLAGILRYGTGAAAQRAAWAVRGSWVDVVSDAMERTRFDEPESTPV